MAGLNNSPPVVREEGAPHATTTTTTTETIKPVAAPVMPRQATNMQQPSMLVPGGSSFDPNREYKVVQREQVANPAPLGLFAFGLTTMLLQGANTAITEGAQTHFLVYGYATFYGGLTQILVGMWEFKRQNTFGAVAFTSYGAWWMSFALWGILVAAGIFTPAHDGLKMLLALWGCFTMIMSVATLELNFALWLLFFSLGLLFFLLAGGVAAVTWERIAGWEGLVVGWIAWYIAAADVINEQYKRTILPIGKWNIGVPMAKIFLRIMGKIPFLGKAYVYGCDREDRLAGFKKTDGDGDKGVEPEGGAGQPGIYWAPYQLHTANEPGPQGLASWEGGAVRYEQRYAPQGSALGPY